MGAATPVIVVVALCAVCRHRMPPGLGRCAASLCSEACEVSGSGLRAIPHAPTVPPNTHTHIHIYTPSLRLYLLVLLNTYTHTQAYILSKAAMPLDVEFDLQVRIRKYEQLRPQLFRNGVVCGLRCLGGRTLDTVHVCSACPTLITSATPYTT